MPRSKAELVALALAHEAAAKALRDELEARAEHAWLTDGAATTDRLGFATASTSTSQDTVAIVDDDLFLPWLKRNHPTEVVDKWERVTRPRNPKWVRKRIQDFRPVATPEEIKELEPDDTTGVVDEDGTIVPGVVWIRGGRFKSISVRPEAAAAERLRGAAQLYAAGEVGMQALEGLH